MSDADTTAWIVREGQEVLGNDGKKVGEVTGSAGSALVVKHGFLFTARDIYVPVSAIANIDTQSVHLNVAADVATSDAWSQPPAGASFVPNVDASTATAETLGSSAPVGNADTWTISEGMAVIGSDGEHIGEVEDGSEDAILVRVGRFFSKTISISAAQISDVRQNAVLVTTTRTILNISGNDESQTTESSAPTASGRGSATTAGDVAGGASDLTPATGDLAASATGLSVSKDDIAHSTDDLASAAADAHDGTSTPLADLQGRITNAWRSSGTQADAEAGAVDLGKPDPEFPITPPSGETPYTAPADAGAAASHSADAGITSGGLGDTLGTDTPDLSIDTPDVAAEVPGLNLADAGIPAASEGGFAATTNSFSFDTPASGTADNAVSALSDAGAIGESPDPNLASEAQELAARESFGEHGYPDLPSDPFASDGDGVRPEDDQAHGLATSIGSSTESSFKDSVTPVDLPGNLNAGTLPDASEVGASVGNELSGSSLAADVDTTPLHADTTARDIASGASTTDDVSADTGIAASRSGGTGASLPPAATGLPREQPTGSSHEARGGLFGQIRQRIQTFFDPHAAEVEETRSGVEAPKTSTTLPGAAVAGAAGLGAAAIERDKLTTETSPVDINATAPDVDVDARIPDAPSLADASASQNLTSDISGTVGSAFDAESGTAESASAQAGDEPGLFGGMKEKVESFLDGPQVATSDSTVAEQDSASITAADATVSDSAALPNPDTVTPDEFAQELYVSDPDIDGIVRTVTPEETGADTGASAHAETESATYDDQRHIDRGSGESEFAPQVSEHPTLGARSELEPDVERPTATDGEHHEGFFEEIREKVEHFLDNPDAAEEPALGTFDYATPADLEHAASDVATPTSGITDTAASTFGAPAADATSHVIDDATSTTHADLASEVSGTDTTTAFDRTAGDTTTAFDRSAFDRTAGDTADTSAPAHDTTAPSTDTSFSLASTDAGDDLLASTSGTSTSDSTGTAASTSRYSVVGEHDDDDDLYDSISGIADTGDASLGLSESGAQPSSELFASDVSVEGASPQFEARASQAATEGNVDVNIDESASVVLGDDLHASDAAGMADEGEQAESDVFAAIVDATDESDIDDFGTPSEHLTHTAPADGEGDTSSSTSSGASGHEGSFSPTPDATLLSHIPSAEDAGAETTDADATSFSDAAAADAGDEAIAANAESGTLADAAEHVATWTSSEAKSTGEQAATFTPTPFSGDETIARNASSGEMEGASDAAADATRQDRTIGENARTGTLSGAGDLARSWTAGEAGTTRANAESAIAGEAATISGATPLSASDRSPSGGAAEEGGDTGTTPASDADGAAAMYGPADTEGIDWAPAVEGQDAPHGWLVKGNADSGIYHTPESSSYERTIPEVWFPTAEAAERAGFRAPRSGHQTAEQAVPATQSAAEAALAGTTGDASGTTSASSLGAVHATSSGTDAADEYDSMTGGTGHSETGAGSDAHASTTDHAQSAQDATDSEPAAAKGHGPAETEGIDWIAAVEGQAPPHGWLVKGNADSGIYHTPESPSYERTIPEVWFPTAEAAERAGFRAPRSGHQTAEQAVPATQSAAEAALAGTTEGSSATETGSVSSSSTASDAAGASSAETVAGNAESGSLADASSAATSWTHGERATTQHGDDAAAFTPSTYASSAAASRIDDQDTGMDTDAGHREDTSSSETHGSGTETHAATAGEHTGSAGATTTGASSPAIVNDAERHQHARTLRRRGPASTEGIDWIAAIPGEHAPEGWPVKGNADSGIYHVPEALSYEKTKPEAWFPSAEAAERSGYRAPRAQRQAGEHGAPAAKSGAANAITGSHADTSSSGTSGSSGSGSHEAHHAETSFSAGTSTSEGREHGGMTGGGAHTSDDTSADAHASTSAHAASGTGDAEATSGHGPAETEGIDWIAAVEGQAPPHGWVVKGNAGSGIYHTPESPSYEQTKPEAWFPNAAAAERAGFRAPRSGHQTAAGAVPATEHAASSALSGTTEESSSTTGATGGSHATQEATGSASAESSGHGPAETEGIDWVTAVEGQDAPHGWLVKGNADSGIYHTPESSSYERTIAEVWFPTAEAAERAGFRAPRSAHHAGESASDASDAAAKQAKDRLDNA